jgi:hypothetical protein
VDSENDWPSPRAGHLQPVGIGVRVGRRTVSRSRTLARAHWILWILFIELQIADVVTTNRALAVPGNWEANPLMQLSQTHLGAVWWLTKIPVIVFAAVAASSSLRPWPMFVAVWYYVIVVSGNLASL